MKGTDLIITVIAVYATGLWSGVGYYEWYLRRLHDTSAYIRRVQQGERRKKVSGR